MGGSSSKESEKSSGEWLRDTIVKIGNTADEINSTSIPGGECIDTGAGYVYIPNTPEQNNADWNAMQNDK